MQGVKKNARWVKWGTKEEKGKKKEASGPGPTETAVEGATGKRRRD